MEHHEQLAALVEAERGERQAQRSLERELAAGQAELAELREQLVTAMADEDQAKAKALGAKRTRREQAVDALSLRVDAAEKRADRAGAARAEHQRDHAADLIAELEPAATEAVEQLAECARALVDADARWRAVAQETDEHLRAHPRAQPGHDGTPPTHGYEAAVSACRDAAGTDARLPVPRWEGLRHFDQQEKVAQLDKLRRLERPTEAQQREKDRLCRELGVTPEAAAVG